MHDLLTLILVLRAKIGVIRHQRRRENEMMFWNIRDFGRQARRR
jgi:hypothetical protein